MTIFKRNLLLFIVMLFLSVNATSQNEDSSITDTNVKVEKKKKKKRKKRKKVKLPKIDLSHWKVTLPVINDEGKPYEICPPEIVNFAKNEIAKPYMYIDSTKRCYCFSCNANQFLN